MKGAGKKIMSTLSLVLGFWFGCADVKALYSTLPSPPSNIHNSGIAKQNKTYTREENSVNHW